MKNRKIPMRSCVVTREKLPKADLLRIVRTPDGIVIVDKTGKLNGKGAYIKRDMDALEKARKSNVLERVLEIEVSDEVYDEIGRVIGGN